MQMMDRLFQNPNLLPVILIGLDNDNKDETYNGKSISSSDFVKKVAPPTSVTPYNDPPLCLHLLFYLNRKVYVQQVWGIMLTFILNDNLDFDFVVSNHTMM